MTVRVHDATLALTLALSSLALPAWASSCAAQDGGAAAQDGGVPLPQGSIAPPIDEPLPAIATGTDAARTRALELFQESADRYREGRFDEAAELLREARRLHPEPVLAYNLARALEGAGDLEGAVAAYRDYLAEAPDAADAPATRARLAGLERHLAEIRAVEEERARLRQEQERSRREIPPPPPARGPEAAPWILTGIGAGGLIAGAVLGGVAVARNGDAQRAPTHAAAVAAAHDASGLATAANVTLIAGGVAALVGVIWGTVDLVTLPSANGTTATLQVGPGTIAVGGFF